MTQHEVVDQATNSNGRRYAAIKWALAISTVLLQFGVLIWGASGLSAELRNQGEKIDEIKQEMTAFRMLALRFEGHVQWGDVKSKEIERELDRIEDRIKTLERERRRP